MYPHPTPTVASESPWNTSTTGAFSNFFATAPPATPPEIDFQRPPPVQATSGVAESSSRSRVSARANQVYSKCVVCYHDVYPADATLPRPCLHGPLHATCLQSEERLALSAADATRRSPALRCIVCHAEISSIAFNLSAEAPSNRLPFQPHPSHKTSPPVNIAPVPPQAFAPPIASSSRHPHTSGPRESTIRLGHGTALDGNAEEDSDPERNSSRIRVDVHVFHHHHHHHHHEQSRRTQHHQHRRSNHINRRLTAGSASRKHKESDRGSRRVVNTERTQNCLPRRRSPSPHRRSHSQSHSQSQSHNVPQSGSRSSSGSPPENRRLSCGARWTASIKRR